MTWIIYSISAFFVWALSNVMGKVIIDKIAKHPIVYLIIYNIIIGVISLCLIPFKGLTFPHGKILLFQIISGILYIVAVIPYLYAIKKEEVSRVVPLWQFIPLFTLLFASIFLDEKLTLNYYFAFVLLVIGGLFISIRKFSDLFSSNSVFWLMVFSSILFSAMDTINKYIFTNTQYWNSFILIRIFSLLFVLLFLLNKNNFIELKKVIMSLNLYKSIFLFFSEFFDFIGIIFYNLALTLGPVSLISSMHGFQPLFTLIIATIVSILFPKHFKEEINKSTLIYKFTAIILMSVGVWLIYK